MSNQVTLISILKSRMQYHEARQKTLAENVANSDTPGFKPQDLRPFADILGGPQNASMMRTQAMHLPQIDDANGQFGGKNAPKFETVPSGNAVNLEDEMTKVSMNQLDFQTAASLYQRSMGYLKIAIGRRG